MNYMRDRVNRREPEQRTWRDEMSQEFKEMCPSLSYEFRLYGFLGCAILGVLLSFFSILFIYFFEMIPFGVTYSFGTIVALCSTMFLVGPCRQLKLMFSKYRWVASSIYLLLTFATLAIAIFATKEEDEEKNEKGNEKQIALIIFILVLLQALAGVWYSLSYIPFARAWVKKMFGCDECLP